MNETHDIVVLGTGAAGLAAALTARTLGASVGLYEKAATVGGTTAVSGGVVWVPAHERPDVPQPPSADDALAYLRALSNETMDDELVGVFVRDAAATLAFIEAHSPVRFSVAEGFPDYKPELPGGRPQGGRSFNPSPFDFAALGDWADRVTAFPQDFSNVGFDAETRARMWGDLGLDDDADVRVTGAALVGGLLRALLDRGVEPRTECRGVRLVRDGDAITGVVLDTPGGRIQVGARRGVILATGGFEWDPELVKAFLRGPMHGAGVAAEQHRRRAPHGDARRRGAGEHEPRLVGAGGQAPRRPLRGPGAQPQRPARAQPAAQRHGQPVRPPVRERGRRLQQPRRRVPPVRRQPVRVPEPPGLDRVRPGAPRRVRLPRRRAGRRRARLVPRVRRPRRAGRPHGDRPRGSLRDAPRLERHAAAGHDPDFGRGASAYDGWWGDTSKPTLAERTLGPIDTAPFYAVAVDIGCMGTKGGPRTDGDGHVLDVDGDPSPGCTPPATRWRARPGWPTAAPGARSAPRSVWGHRAAAHAVGVPIEAAA